MADEINLEFIARQLQQVLERLRAVEARAAENRDETRLLRDEIHLMRSTLIRLDDTIRMNVLDRLRALESRE